MGQTTKDSSIVTENRTWWKCCQILLEHLSILCSLADYKMKDEEVLRERNRSGQSKENMNFESTISNSSTKDKLTEEPITNTEIEGTVCSSTIFIFSECLKSWRISGTSKVMCQFSVLKVKNGNRNFPFPELYE